MDMNEYMAVWIVRERLTESRASAARRSWSRSYPSPCRHVRLSLGHILIRVGHWILGPVPEYSPKSLGLLLPGASGQPTSTRWPQGI